MVKVSTVNALPLQWIGSKFNLAPLFIKLFPKDYKAYVEVFGGSLAVLLRLPPSHQRIEIINDLDKDLVNFYLIVRDRINELAEKVREWLISRVLYEQYEKDLSVPIENEKIGKDVERASKYLYRNRLVLFDRTRLDRHWKGKIIGVLKLVANRLRNVIIECLDFKELLKKYNKSDYFMYLDPPYFGLEYYDEKFGKERHEELRDILKKAKFKWMLSYAKVDTIMEWYKDYWIMQIEHKSTIANVPRIYYEIIITNYKIDKVESDKVMVVNNGKE